MRAAPAVVAALAAAVLVLTGCSGEASAQAATTRTAIALPPANGRFDYQLGGAYRPAASVRIVDRDRGAEPAPGRYGICYVNAFQSQPGERAFWTGQHPDLLLRTAAGKLVEDADWPGEYFLDTRTAAKREALAAIVGGWIDGCAAKGFRAVEPDNLDTSSRTRLLTRSGNLAFATLLAERAHADGLAIAQKNDAGITRAERRRVGFDFAIAEECQVHHECGAYTRVYGDQVYEIEYTDSPHAASVFRAACAARGADIAIVLRDRDVVPRSDPAYRYRTC